MVDYVCPAGFVLRARARQYDWEGTGWLSLKSFRGGTARYNAGGGTFVVGDGRYLLLNNDQHYHIAIEAPAPVSSFCLFFDPDMMGQVSRTLRASPTALLDDPWQTDLAPHLYEHTYPPDPSITPLLDALDAAYADGSSGDAAWLDEQLRALAAALLRRHAGLRQEVDRIPARRPATRDELYRRVALAYEYAAAHFRDDVPLSALAQVACLSPNHLLRIFRAVYHQSPHQCIMTLRLREAMRLLRATDLPVTEVGLAVGYTSLGTFSARFHQRTGLSPTAFRQTIE